MSRRDFFERPRRPARRRAVAAAGAALAAGLVLGPSLAPVTAGGIELARTALAGVERATVVGARRVSAENVVRVAGVERGTPLADVDPEAVARRVQALPGVRLARVWRLPAGRLVIGLREREPRARLLAGQGWQGVDAAGVVFPLRGAGPRELASLPEVRAALAGIAPGEAHPRLAGAAALIRAAEARGLRVAAVDVGGDARATTLRLRGLAAPFVVGGAPWEPALERLVRLLGRRPALVLRASRVDLRFAGQAVLRGGEEVLGAPGGASPAAPAPGAAAASNRSAAG